MTMSANRSGAVAVDEPINIVFPFAGFEGATRGSRWQQQAHGRASRARATENLDHLAGLAHQAVVQAANPKRLSRVANLGPRAAHDLPAVRPVADGQAARQRASREQPVGVPRQGRAPSPNAHRPRSQPVNARTASAERS